MYRRRKQAKQYEAFEQIDCPFCGPYAKPNLIETTSHSRVIRNKFPYDHWEGRNVVGHLMIIPNRHATSLADLRPKELADVIQLSAKYEALGFNVYARAPDNAERSVVHQHTHLIKTTDKKAKLTVYVAKPYYVLKV